MRKKGSGNQPTLLRRYNERPMAVILFNQQPLNCEVMTQISHHKETPYIHVRSKTIKKKYIKIIKS